MSKSRCLSGKLHLLFFTIIAIIPSALAQFNNNERDYKWGVGMQVNAPINDIKISLFSPYDESIDGSSTKDKSYALGMSITRRFKQEIALRFRFGYTKINLERHDDLILLGGDRMVGDGYGRQRKLHFMPGIIRELTKNNLSIYAGFEIPVNIHNEFTWTYDQVDTDTTGNVLFSSVGEAVIPKGMSYGIAAIIGFNFYLTRKISLGAEINPTFIYNKLGGIIMSSLTQTYPPVYPPDTATITTMTNDKTEEWAQQIRFSFSINYSFKH